MNLTNRLVLGFAQSDKNYGFNKNKNFLSVVKKSYNYGFKYLDTASSYKFSNSIIKTIPKKNINIISKITCNYDYNSDYKKLVRQEIEGIYKDNNINKLYGLLIHDPLLPLNKKKWRIVFNYLKKYKKKGKIKKIGVSVYTVQELKNILNIFKPDIIQFPLNVFDQSFIEENFLKILKKKKIELHARSIFLQGTLLRKSINSSLITKTWKNNFKNWNIFLRNNKISNLSGCLKFILQNKYIDKFVVGFDDKIQLEKFINVYSKLKKNKIINKISFKEFNSKDLILNDPRYWKILKYKSKKNLIDWVNTKNKVLNGSMLLSKRPNQFLPGGWPTFYKKSKGCFIWDNYGNKLIDFSYMGIGTNILGYSDSKVNNYVQKIIKSGNISTLNSNLDKKLTDELIKLHPWASMATYARTCAEANAIALRLARIYSNKEEVAICGYHGWHDWYLSANLKNKKNLNKIHLANLSTIGIPKKLEGLSHPFFYNDISSFKKIVKKNNIGAVFMEVQRNELPKNNFLEKVREITKNKNIVLIFDECSSGFRETNGGIHKKFKIIPDLVIFGKSLGNGIPITSVLGKKEIMVKGEDSFISSTFWTDATGPAAAIATLKEMHKKKSWIKITNTGRKIKQYWKYLSKKYNIIINIQGLDAMPTFNFKHELDLYFRTYITQEMLQKNILATNTVYCCTLHNKFLKRYFIEFEKVFKKINYFIHTGNIMNSLKYPVVQPGFNRLN